MSTVDDHCSDPPPNHLGWQGWQMDLPSDWNPARLTGNDRAGSLIVSDLDCPRLEVTWKTVRSTAAVDLSRLTAKARRGRPRWSLLPLSDLGKGILCGYQSVAGDGAISMMLLSGASRRLALVKLTPRGRTGRGAPPALTLDDASAGPIVPWCVYGFAWAVPAGFRLVDQSFTPGHIRVEFRNRWQGLTFERWTLAGGWTETDASVSDTMPALRSCNGHDLRIRSLPTTGLWNRLWHRPSAQAEWVCPVAQRRYRVSASGSHPLSVLETSLGGIICHD